MYDADILMPGPSAQCFLLTSLDV
ncbi:hypothetical protein BsWGS_25255 [Bradybaena similaris]